MGEPTRAAPLRPNTSARRAARGGRQDSDEWEAAATARVDPPTAHRQSAGARAGGGAWKRVGGAGQRLPRQHQPMPPPDLRRPAGRSQARGPWAGQAWLPGWSPFMLTANHYQKEEHAVLIYQLNHQTWLYLLSRFKTEEHNKPQY